MGSIEEFFGIFLSLMGTFSIFDFIDILLMAFVIYGAIKFIRETRAGQLVKGMAILVFVYVISFLANLKMVGSALGNFFQFAFLAVLIVLQPEIRNILEHLGRSKIGSRYTAGLVEIKESEEDAKKRSILDVVNCAAAFQISKTGAIIVFERQTKLGEIISSGTIINALSSVALISSIFFNKAPLHDGAVIIRCGKIYAAGCILPLSSGDDIDVELGTRHRAALGMSEYSDAVIVIISEETGIISFASKGNLKRNLNKETLKVELENAVFYNVNSDISFKSSVLPFWKKK
ncbi:MAG: diadenylate cyclase CdaA [Oscillospiraceae bacterium]|jgi:diadenylate cyclase|nr:diadenylate cyclase CdaA [Oscillospiraceae bacterium]